MNIQKPKVGDIIVHVYTCRGFYSIGKAKDEGILAEFGKGLGSRECVGCGGGGGFDDDDARWQAFLTSIPFFPTTPLARLLPLTSLSLSLQDIRL